MIYQEEVKDHENWTEIFALIKNQTGLMLHSLFQLLLSFSHGVLFQGPSPRFCSYWPSLTSATIFKLISELNYSCPNLSNKLRIVTISYKTPTRQCTTLCIYIINCTFSFTCPGFVVFLGHIYGKMYFSKFMEASRERLAGSDGPDGHRCHNDH